MAKRQRYASTQPARSSSLDAGEVDRQKLSRPLTATSDLIDSQVREMGWMMAAISILVGAVKPEYIWWVAVFQGGLMWRMRSLQLDWLLDCPDDEPVSRGQYYRVRALQFVGHVLPRQWTASLLIRYGDGIIRLGNDVDRWMRVLAASMGRMVTHAKVFGTTGSGKTQWLLGLLDQVIAKGSGTIFVDGKADIVTWFLLYQMCRAAGREDDLLVINFLTGGTTVEEQTKHTNTNNLFAFGSSDSLMEMLSALMGEAGSGDGMWRGRAESLGRAVLRALCELRDKGVLALSVETIREHLTLDAVEALSADPRLSDMARIGLTNYLAELPGWQASQSEDGAQPTPAQAQAKAKASEQHGYLAMQWTAVLELLGATYKAITKTDLSEVDFKDVILNRRILYVMLPAIEKSPESLKNLGRMAVTAIRNALVIALGGSVLTGRKDVLVDGRPTNASTPFIIALDEYGSYCVEGFADVAAQARSLGVSTLFLGQDYPSFKKGSEIEAERIEANTGISVFLKTENQATAELAIRRAGKMNVFMAEYLEPYKVGATRRKLDQRYRSQEVDRITLRELAAQKAGEARIIYGDQVWHIQSFYGNYQPAGICQVNTFVRLHRPKVDIGQTKAGEGENSSANAKKTMNSVTKQEDYTSIESHKRSVVGQNRHHSNDRVSGAQEISGKQVALAKAVREAVKSASTGFDSSPVTSEVFKRLTECQQGLSPEAGIVGLLGKHATPKQQAPGLAPATKQQHEKSLLLAAAEEVISMAKENKWDAWEGVDEQPELVVETLTRTEGGRVTSPPALDVSELDARVRELLCMLDESESDELDIEDLPDSEQKMMAQTVAIDEDDE